MPAAPLRERLRLLARAGALGRVADGAAVPSPPAVRASPVTAPPRPEASDPAAVQAEGGAAGHRPGASPARRR